MHKKVPANQKEPVYKKRQGTRILQVFLVCNWWEHIRVQRFNTHAHWMFSTTMIRRGLLTLVMGLLIDYGPVYSPSNDALVYKK